MVPEDQLLCLLTFTHACITVNVQQYTHIHIHIYTHTYTHVYVYTHTDAHIHVYTHTLVYTEKEREVKSNL